MGKFGKPFNWDEVSPELEAEETLDDSDKTISVPAGEEWNILSIHIEYTATATVGSRRLTIYIRDTADDTVYIIGEIELTAGQIGILAAVCASSVVPATAADSLPPDGVPVYVREQMPLPLIVPSGFDLRIWDRMAIDAAADDMIIQMMVKKRRMS